MNDTTVGRERYGSMRSYAGRFLTGPDTPDWRNRGMVAADLHVHTYFSGDVLPVNSSSPQAMYARAKQVGIRYVSFTDHETMDAYDCMGWEREGLIPGVELKILDKKAVGHTIHVNVYMLNRKQFRECMEITRGHAGLECFLQFLNENDLPHTYNHPFWFEAGEVPNPEAVPEIAKLFPVLEYNRGRILPLNRMAVILAESNDKGLVACSDAHTAANLGAVRTYARGETFREYFENIKRGNVYLLTRDLTVPLLIEEANEWIRQIFGPELIISTDGEPHGPYQAKDFDWLLDLFCRGRLASRPWFRGMVRRLLYALSNSGIIQSFYVSSQDNLASEISRQLRIA